MFPEILINAAKKWATDCREAGFEDEAALLDGMAAFIENATTKETPDMSTMTHRGRAEYEARAVSGPVERGHATSRLPEPPPTMGNRPIDKEPNGEVRSGLYLLNQNLSSIEKAVMLLDETIAFVLVSEAPATARGDMPEPPPPVTAVGADIRQLNEFAARIFDRLTALRFRVSI